MHECGCVSECAGGETVNTRPASLTLGVACTAEQMLYQQTTGVQHQSR